ncbi:MAG: DUF1080 domain-containing protein [Tannerella sp.]|jgi:hypothetical protein|nr:DUF1080 domain-containing protein [Tannerella sp.]
MKKKAVFMYVLAVMSAVAFGQSKEKNLSEPQVVVPGTCGSAPSDAIVLFDGKDFSQWESVKGGEVKWKLADNAMTVVEQTGSIQTRQSFGDCQLHIEWRIPANVAGEGQNRGNSGIFLQKQYEIQVLDSYNNQNKTYVDGRAGSIYTQSPPLVNASLQAGEWQTYDVVYMAPRFNTDGKVEIPARITVFHNGVLIQNHFVIEGTTYNKNGYNPHYRAPLELQDHGNPVSFRNIWIREL